MAALRLVYRNPWNVLLALGAFVAMAVFYLWSSEVLVIGGHGVSILVHTQYIAAALVMALSFGLLLPLLVCAIRLAAASVAHSGGTALGAVFGTLSMTCCAPVVLPAILSFLGFSGTSILSVNETLNRFWLPLATISIILLTYALVSVVQSLNLQCSLEESSPDVESADRTGGKSAVRELASHR